MSFPTQAMTSKTTDLKDQLAQIGLLALSECIEDFLARAARFRDFRRRGGGSRLCDRRRACRCQRR